MALTAVQYASSSVLANSLYIVAPIVCVCFLVFFGPGLAIQCLVSFFGFAPRFIQASLCKIQGLFMDF